MRPFLLLTLLKNFQQCNVHIVMLVCMASYMTVGYMHANHAFRVNVRSWG